MAPCCSVRWGLRPFTPSERGWWFACGIGVRGLQGLGPFSGDQDADAIHSLLSPKGAHGTLISSSLSEFLQPRAKPDSLERAGSGGLQSRNPSGRTCRCSLSVRGCNEQTGQIPMKPFFDILTRPGYSPLSGVRQGDGSYCGISMPGRESGSDRLSRRLQSPGLSKEPSPA